MIKRCYATRTQKERFVVIVDRCQERDLDADQAIDRIDQLQAVADAAYTLSVDPHSNNLRALVKALDILRVPDPVETLSERRTAAVLRLETISASGDRVGMVNAVDEFLSAEKAYQEAIDQ